MVTGRERYLQPLGGGGGPISTDQWKAWNEYRNAGGVLEISDWIAAGSPNITEERADIAWMQRYIAYQDYQVEQGFISPEERNVTLQDVEQQILGVGEYQGEPKHFYQLNQGLQSDVERYWTGLPVAEQKRKEAEARAFQEQREVTAGQLGQLPLYARGTQEDQVIAGQNAIRQLQLQKTTAPDYLQGIIDSQIIQLQQGVSQLTSSIQERARIQTAERRGEEEGGGEEPGTFAQKFSREHEMVTPEAAQQIGMRYQANPESEEFANLTSAEKAQLSWVGKEAIQGGLAPTRAAPVTIEPPTFEEVGVTGPPRWKSWFESNYPSIVSQFSSKTVENRTASGWAKFLENERARIKEEFASLGPYARGERPGAYAPKVRTIAF